MLTATGVVILINKNDHSEVPFLSRSAPFMDEIVVSKGDVTKLLKGLNPSKALGPDELHHRVLKEFATELSPVLPIYSNSLLIRVKSPKRGLLQIYVASIKRMTEVSHVIIVPFL